MELLNDIIFYGYSTIKYKVKILSDKIIRLFNFIILINY